jgi:hypothetical protein
MTRSALLLGLLLWGAGGFAQNGGNLVLFNDGLPMTIVIQDEQLRPLVGAIAEVTTLSRRQFRESNGKGEVSFGLSYELGYMLRIRQIGFVDWYKPIPQDAISLNFLRVVMEPIILSTDSTTTLGKKKLTALPQRRQSNPRE